MQPFGQLKKLDYVKLNTYKHFGGRLSVWESRISLAYIKLEIIKMNPNLYHKQVFSCVSSDPPFGKDWMF